MHCSRSEVYVCTVLYVWQSVRFLAAQLELWLPQRPSKKAELNLKRAVISCYDTLTEAVSDGAGAGASAPSKLDVEDLVAQAADNGAPDAFIASIPGLT